MKFSIFKRLLAVLLAAGIGSLQAQAVELETGVAELRPLSREFRLDGVVEAVNRTTVTKLFEVNFTFQENKPFGFEHIFLPLPATEFCAIIGNEKLDIAE